MTVIIGYALDPTVGLAQNEGSSYVGDIESAESSSGRTVFENPNRPDPSRAGVKRKIEKNDDSADLEGYKGPWAPYENESRSAKPSEVKQYIFLPKIEEINICLSRLTKKNLMPIWQK